MSQDCQRRTFWNIWQDLHTRASRAYTNTCREQTSSGSSCKSCKSLWQHVIWTSTRSSQKELYRLMQGPPLGISEDLIRSSCKDVEVRTAPQREQSDTHKVARRLRLSATFFSKSIKYGACHEKWARGKPGQPFCASLRTWTSHEINFVQEFTVKKLGTTERATVKKTAFNTY